MSALPVLPTTSIPRPFARGRGSVILAGVVAAVLALFLPLGSATAAPAEVPPSTPLEQVQAYVQPSVVYQQLTWTAYAYDTTNKQYFREEPFTVSYPCTGFVVNSDGYIATAGHCVEFDAEVRLRLAEQVAQWANETRYYEIDHPVATILTFADNWRFDGQNTNGKPDLAVNVAYGVSVSGEPTGKALPARLVGLRGFGEGDVALLKVDGQNLTTVPLSSNENTGVGTQVVSVGYPSSVDLVTDNNFNPSFKEGTISAEKTTSGGLYQVYEISAAVSPGMSGGPTSAMDGTIIGVNSFTITGETQPFNFVQPSQTLEELMRSEGVTNSPGEVTDLYRAGLAAYFDGDKDAAVQNFEKVLAIVPSHQFAQEYLQKSEALSSGGPFGLSLPLLIGILAALLLLVVVLVAAVVLSRRSRGTPGTTGPQPEPVSGEPLYAAPGTATTAMAATAPSGSGMRKAGVVPPPPPPAFGGTSDAAPAPQAEAPPPPPSTAGPTAAPPAPAAAEPAPPETAAAIPEAPAAPAEDSDVELFCPHCGKRHEPDDHFCPHCGHDLHH